MKHEYCLIIYLEKKGKNKIKSLQNYNKNDNNILFNDVIKLWSNKLLLSETLVNLGTYDNALLLAQVDLSDFLSFYQSIAYYYQFHLYNMYVTPQLVLSKFTFSEENPFSEPIYIENKLNLIIKIQKYWNIYKKKKISTINILTKVLLNKKGFDRYLVYSIFSYLNNIQ